LKSSESRQLAFAFADNSQESRHTPKADVSAGKAYLLYQADANLTTETDARIDSGGEPSAENLLEEVASLPNLAVALLRVASNKGAPGVDGLCVAEVVEHAPQLLPKVQRALLQGNFIPGDIRRVWIPKPGGGQTKTKDLRDGKDTLEGISSHNRRGGCVASFWRHVPFRFCVPCLLHHAHGWFFNTKRQHCAFQQRIF
jgi:hypothetical protein